MQGALLLHKLG